MAQSHWRGGPAKNSGWQYHLANRNLLPATQRSVLARHPALLCRDGTDGTLGDGQTLVDVGPCEQPVRQDLLPGLGSYGMGVHGDPRNVLVTARYRF